ncbi:MAG: Plug domain-containing protein, partial [Pseudolabrys sp.]
MGVGYRVCKLVVVLTAGASAIVALEGHASAQQVITLPPIDVIGITPIPGSELDRNKIPANVQTIPSSDFDHAISPSLVDAMIRALPAVSRGDQTGNPFQPDIDYRGFTASPVPGTPQGLAVYQNGARINETFGDTVNWDLIPEMAVNRLTLTPNNPVYGLNA